ncbi:hypothetical protein RFI_17080 [Reticulomyxa filosa]|uniref:Uncharacterized protein n=1 Tax=Reticulomyxa filosa TaxID=46433 RepID=X6N2K8_RETFI|nr:hypothetical protein RFI_17080 [Reticulomyxa filosa]|eukprot:ETO20138.1 hypothetical protein RFI_17080 [Reticulomyxa filosa]
MWQAHDCVIACLQSHNNRGQCNTEGTNAIKAHFYAFPNILQDESYHYIPFWFLLTLIYLYVWTHVLMATFAIFINIKTMFYLSFIFQTFYLSQWKKIIQTKFQSWILVFQKVKPFVYWLNLSLWDKGYVFLSCCSAAEDINCVIIADMFTANSFKEPLFFQKILCKVMHIKKIAKI